MDAFLCAIHLLNPSPLPTPTALLDKLGAHVWVPNGLHAHLTTAGWLPIPSITCIYCSPCHDQRAQGEMNAVKFLSFLLLNLGLGVEVAAVRARGLLEEEGRLAAGGLGELAEAGLRAIVEGLSFAEAVDDVLEGLPVEVLIIVVAVVGGVGVVGDDDGGGVDAAAEALGLAEGEEAVVGGALHGDVEVLLGAVQEVVDAHDLARGRDAELNVELADGLAVEHRVEGDGLEDVHRGALANLRDLVHGGDGHVAAVLRLREVEKRNDAALPAGAGKLLHNFVDLLVRLNGEVPRDTSIVDLRVVVAHLAAEGAGGGGEGGGRGGAAPEGARDEALHCANGASLFVVTPFYWLSVLFDFSLLRATNDRQEKRALWITMG